MSHVHTHEKHESGFSFRIILDSDGSTDSPVEDSESVRFFVFHRRYKNPGADFASDPESLAQWEADNAAQWESFPLFLYDHSGTCYRPSRGGNPFSCPWDSGRVGSIALKRGEFGEGADLFKAAESFCAVYTSWTNGEIYGFEVLDPKGESVESVWGFIGDPDESGVITEARAAMESAIAEHAARVPVWTVAPGRWILENGARRFCIALDDSREGWNEFGPAQADAMARRVAALLNGKAE